MLRLGLRIADASASAYLKLKFNALYLLIVGATFSKYFFIASLVAFGSMISMEKVKDIIQRSE